MKLCRWTCKSKQLIVWKSDDSIGLFYIYTMEAIGREHMVEHIFRHEYGKIIAFLTHKFGPSHLETIEDAVQEALIKAMQIWGFNEPPTNPTAWLLKVAKNKVIDSLRKQQKMLDDAPISDYGLPSAVQEEVLLNTSISDSQLKMIFACCHPSLSQEHQIILSLKLIAGFGNKEIAKALLKKNETVAKSFTRAKQRFKATVKTLNIPVELGLKSRLNIVLKVIYLLFSEGYASSSGEVLIKKDICIEAIGLATLLSNNKYCNQPEVHALIALMNFHASRFDARIDENGEIVDLENQNRKLYDSEMIKSGIHHLELSRVRRNPSHYHLQAAISFFHCSAKGFADTDWERILQLYDLQLARQYSPIIQLNRIVPFHKVHGAQKAMKELQQFEKSDYFIDNALFNAIKAQLMLEMNNLSGSKKAFKKAIQCTQNALERKHFQKKLESLNSR